MFYRVFQVLFLYFPAYTIVAFVIVVVRGGGCERLAGDSRFSDAGRGEG